MGLEERWPFGGRPAPRVRARCRAPTPYALDEALKPQTWDDSVKALVAFPQVVTMMSDKLDWTQKLGDAFLGQQKDLMDAIQRLRAKAQAQGNLKDTSEQKIVVEPAPPPAVAQAAPPPTTIIMIEPANPQVIYVPTYNPTVVYGAWPYPAYPPYYYYPPGYAMATAATGRSPSRRVSRWARRSGETATGAGAT